MSKLSHSTTYTVSTDEEGHWALSADGFCPPGHEPVDSGLMLDDAMDLIEYLANRHELTGRARARAYRNAQG